MNSVRPLGPWTVTCARDRAGAYNNIGAPNCEERDVALISCDHPRYREVQALICAAPEMLAVLKRVLGSNWTGDDVRAVIAKAESRS